MKDPILSFLSHDSGDDAGAIFDKLPGLLLPFRLHVYYDPAFKGSSTYGVIISKIPDLTVAQLNEASNKHHR